MATEYDVAQVCPYGHLANSSAVDFPQHNKDYCEHCGEKTLTACLECENPIRGSLRRRVGGSYQPPSFCRSCGVSFPWTERKISAAIELAALDLTEQDAEEFRDSVNEIARDTPRARVAASRVKALLGKFSSTTAQVVRELLVDVASETAKKIILEGK